MTRTIGAFKNSNCENFDANDILSDVKVPVMPPYQGSDHLPFLHFLSHQGA